MSKSRKKIDSKDFRQLTFDDLPQKVESYLERKTEIHNAINERSRPPARHLAEDFDEDAIELAAAVKQAIRESEMSRREVVDAINTQYGWPTIDQAEQMSERPENHLSLHMFNHYLSKPTEYKMPGAILFGIVRATRSLEPIRAIAASVGGDVLSRDEKDELLLGKMEKAVYEMNRLSRELKTGKRSRR